MARNLQITDRSNNFNFNSKYDPLSTSRDKIPPIVYKNQAGEVVKQVSTDEHGNPLGPTQRRWMNDKNVEFSKDELTAYDEKGKELSPYEATTIFNIVKYEDEDCYFNDYVIEKFYEIYPSDDGKKKDIDRRLAEDINREGMKQLYDYLVANKCVAKAEFIPTTGNYRQGAGYIRAIQVKGGKWTLELGAFKEKKIFKRLQEMVVKKARQLAAKATKRENSLL